MKFAVPLLTTKKDMVGNAITTNAKVVEINEKTTKRRRRLHTNYLFDDSRGGDCVIVALVIFLVVAIVPLYCICKRQDGTVTSRKEF